MLFALCCFIPCYAFSWVALSRIIVGEIFTHSVRGIVLGFHCFNRIGSLAVGIVFSINTAKFFSEVIFLALGIICILGLLFMSFVVLETKGCGLEQI
ncbi:MFS transporter [Neobacillus sp. SM06]|uniref:MFS transporter n=1 Tax=Neobacillus sp. SM06 TaxID=3422492 RepID=UPI003D28E6CE